MTSECDIAVRGRTESVALVATQRGARQLLLSALATCAAAAAVGLATLIGTAPAAWAVKGDSPRQMTLYVTDRGIDQMRHWESGREQGLTWTMSNPDPAARIAVVMPREDFSSAVQRRKIYNDLKQPVDAALQRGQTELEIQLVQDVTLPGYFAPWRQNEAIEFGAAAYAAIRDINVYLERQSVRVTNRANVGSNGSVVFAANVDAWSTGTKAIWRSVDIFDGRAFLVPMVKAIDRIGAQRVRIFNTRFDVPATNTPWAFRSLANAATSQQLKDQYFQDLKVYKLFPVKIMLGHIAGMVDANAFHVEEYLGRRVGYKPVPGKFFGSALRRPNGLPAASERSMPAGLTEGVPVWKSIAEGFLDALGKYADGFGEKYGQEHALTHPLQRAATVANVIQAVNEDIATAGESTVVFFKSRTLEAVLNFIVEEVASAGHLRAKHAKDVEGYTASVSAVMELLRSGKPNADVVEKISKAAAVAAQRRLADAHSADVAAKVARLETMQRQAARLERERQELSKAVFLAGRDRDTRRGLESQLRAVSGKLAGTTEKLGTARMALNVARQRFVLASVGLDVLPALAAAVTEHVTQRHLTIEVGDRYSDVLLTLGGSLVAAVVVATNPGLAVFAPAIKEAVVAGGKLFNDVGVRPFFDHSFMWEALDAYHKHQTFAARHGMKLETLSEFYGYKNLRGMGMSDRQIAEQDARARQMIEAELAHSPLDAARPAPQASQQALQPLPNALPKLDLQAAKMQAANGGTPDAKPATRNSEIAAKEPEKPGAPTIVRVKKPRQDDEPPLPPGGRRGPPGAGGGGPGGGGGRAPGGGDGPEPPCGPGGIPCGGIDLGLTALVVDPATRKIVALADGGMPQTEAVDPDLMALAVWLEYTGQQAAFSLDPYDPKDPKGPWLRAVYFPEALRGTVAGNQCFDADFLLKQMSFGVRVEGDRVVERQSASGLESIPMLMSKREATSPEQWSRLWIVSREVHLVAGDGIVRVDRARMGVEARRQVPDRSTRSGLRDADTPTDAIEQQFARRFEQLYDQLAATEAPSLAAVREVTKAIALARWLRQSGVRVDMPAVVAQLNGKRVPAVDKVSALSVGWSSQTQEPYSNGTGSGVVTTTRRLHVFGGVDLSVAPKVAKSTRDESLREAVAMKLRQTDAPARFELTHAGRVYRAYVMPFQIADGRGG